MDAIAAAGGNAFFDYQVPSAVITLKQGFGRLIRSLSTAASLCCSTPASSAVPPPHLPRVAAPYRQTQSIQHVEAFFVTDV